MAQIQKRNRTTTSLSLAALILSLGIEPIASEAQQYAETPEAIPGDPPPVTGGGGTGAIIGGINLTDPPISDTIGGGGIGGQTYTYVAPPGSGYIFTQPPPADYIFQPPGSGSCDGGTGVPFCRDTQKDCCPDPNVVNQFVCCTPYTGAA